MAKDLYGDWSYQTPQQVMHLKSLFGDLALSVIHVARLLLSDIECLNSRGIQNGRDHIVDLVDLSQN